MTDETTRLYWRVYHLPDQLAKAREKVARLERRAREYGMKELLENPEQLDVAWDREVAAAWAMNTECPDAA